MAEPEITGKLYFIETFFTNTFHTVWNKKSVQFHTFKRSFSNMLHGRWYHNHRYLFGTRKTKVPYPINGRRYIDRNRQLSRTVQNFRHLPIVKNIFMQHIRRMIIRYFNNRYFTVGNIRKRKYFQRSRDIDSR